MVVVERKRVMPNLIYDSRVTVRGEWALISLVSSYHHNLWPSCNGHEFDAPNFSSTLIIIDLHNSNSHLILTR